MIAAPALPQRVALRVVPALPRFGALARAALRLALEAAVREALTARRPLDGAKQRLPEEALDAVRRLVVCRDDAETRRRLDMALTIACDMGARARGGR